MKLFNLFLFFTFLNTFTLSQSTINSTELLTTLIAAEDITDADEITSIKAAYRSILQDAGNTIDDEDNIYDKHKALFKLLHSDYLKKYKFEAYFSNLFKAKEFNCLTAVILYQMICLDLNLDIKLYKTPFHVYITVPASGKKDFIIELTDPVDGFDSKLDLDDYIEYMLDYKLITEDELKLKGENEIYREFETETHQIDIKDLIAAYYSNLAGYNIKSDNTLKAYRLIKKAVALSNDSLIVQTHNIIWYLHTEKIKSDADLYTSFLLESLDSIPASKEFYDEMIRSAAVAIDLNIEKNNFDDAEHILDRLNIVLPKEMLNDNYIVRINIAIKSSIINNRVIRGDYAEAFKIAGNLYRKYRDNEKILDLYLSSGNMYMQHLGLNQDTEKLLEVADTMFTNAPGIKSVEDNYTLACIHNVINSGLYRTNPDKSKQILIDAHNKLPKNKSLISSIGYLYHEIAMSEIRNRHYKKAIDILNDGLQYDPDNWELKHEIDLTKELLNKR